MIRGRTQTLLLVALGAVACHRSDATSAELTSAKQEAAIRVETARADEVATPEYLTLTGTLKASQESDVAADAAGKVSATFVERGQPVKQGDTLVVLDARSASLNANAAAAQSSVAKAQMEQALSECERVKTLFKNGVIPGQEFSRMMTNCQASQYQAQAALAQSQSAQKAVGDMIIRAPFTGVVGDRAVNVGQYVAPSTKVVSLYMPDPLRLELTVPEANLGSVKADLPVVFNVSAFGDKTFTGAVKYISPNVRPSTRDLVVEAVVPNAELELKPGMFAVARLQIGEKKLPAVPTSAIKKDESGARVYVVVDKRIQERVVQLGGEKDGLVGIAVGVKPGEAVVVKPGADVRDGVPVQ